MSALQEAEDALEKFIDEYVSCTTCRFWRQELFGGRCEGPELQCGDIEDDTSCCEQHEFTDDSLQRELENLQHRWSNAWHIVEGFIYFEPPTEKI